MTALGRGLDHGDHPANAAAVPIIIVSLPQPGATSLFGLPWASPLQAKEAGEPGNLHHVPWPQGPVSPSVGNTAPDISFGTSPPGPQA